MSNSRDHRIERAVERILRQVDPTRPYAHQLEQVARRAIGYGLLRAAQGRAVGHIASRGLRARIETAVASLAGASYQTDLQRAARQAGVQPEDVLAGLVLKHCHEDLEPLTAEQVARYSLDFARALAEARPELAARYRRRLTRSRG